MMFFAQLNHTLHSVAVEQGIVFENVVTNVRECYSGHTGVFTCCQPGYYLLSWNIATISREVVYTELMVNTTSRAISQDSMTVIIPLHVDDEVWIRVQSRSTSSAIVGNKATSFIGFLI